MRRGKQSSLQVLNLLKAKSTLEGYYGRALLKISKSFNSTTEIGSLKDSLDVLVDEFTRSAQAHIGT